MKGLDFNLTPDDPGYSLLVGDPIIPPQEELLALSRVVHTSIDPDWVPPAEAKEAKKEGDDGAEQDPDRIIIVNARTATPADGLLSTEQLVEMIQTLGVANLESSYDKGLEIAKASGESDIQTYGDRVAPIAPKRLGRHEPEWTSYTHFWKTVLGFFPSPINSCLSLNKFASRLYLHLGSPLTYFTRSWTPQAAHSQGYGTGPPAERCMRERSRLASLRDRLDPEGAMCGFG